MEVTDLIGKLRDVRSNFPGCKVVIATGRQVTSPTPIPGLVAAYRVPIADGSCLGDADGELDALFIVATRDV